MAKIKSISAREILDSRGNPTIETTVLLDNYFAGTAAVPSGASKGSFEAIELRDGDIKRYSGMGVMKAIENIQRTLSPLLTGRNPEDQKQIDNDLISADGTENKRNLGANSILSLSLAVAVAAAKAQTIPLYKYLQHLSGTNHIASTITPLFNVINGGAHGSNKLSFQEFMFIPSPDYPYEKSLQIGTELYQLLKRKLKENNLNYSLGDEGGFSPALASNDEALSIMLQTIESSPYKWNNDVYLGLDIAASEFFSSGKYSIASDQTMSPLDYMNYLLELIKKYKLLTIEDAFAEDDWENWSLFTSQVSSNISIVGDDLLVTNIKRLQKAIDTAACNSVLVKLNQIGTVSETLEVIQLARKSNFKVIISHRSGETNDDFIADLAVGVAADFVKFGAPARGERVAKYNRLLQIYKNRDSNLQ